MPHVHSPLSPRQGLCMYPIPSAKARRTYSWLPQLLSARLHSACLVGPSRVELDSCQTKELRSAKWLQEVECDEGFSNAHRTC